MKKNIKSLTKLVGIVGHPIAHSWSPVIYETAFKLTKQNFSYFAFDVLPKDLRDALKGVQALGIAGLNVTVPHKEAVTEFLDEMSADARLVGAVNTIYVANDLLIGHNTDVDGAVAALKPFREQIDHESVTIFGAGGGARAVIYSLVSYFHPGQIFVINRDTSRAELLRKFFSDSQNYKNIKIVDLHSPDEGNAVETSKLVVNATQVGMSPDVNENIMLQDGNDYTGKIFFDLVYNPIQTSFLNAAKKKNAITVSGLEMLYHQAAKAFELWTGVSMPLENVRSRLDKKFFDITPTKKQKIAVH